MLARYPVNVKLLTLFLFGMLAHAATFTIRNVNIVDADSGTIRKNRNVTIKGSVITSVSEPRAARLECLPGSI